MNLHRTIAAAQHALNGMANGVNGQLMKCYEVVVSACMANYIAFESLNGTNGVQ